MSVPDYDLCVVGGGINGAGIAHEAAARGLSVLLVEAEDLGGATSSASTKLIHGGLRYLEYYEFRLVYESLKERARLLKIAPHIIRPMDFVLVQKGKVRPAWLVRLGLWLYDVLALGHGIKSSSAVDLDGHELGAPLAEAGKGFIYADCWAEDARLVVLNAMAAKEKGAKILTRTECTGLKHRGDHWLVRLKETGKEKEIKAGMVVNATGPWVRSFLDECNVKGQGIPNVRLVKGSHIVIRKAYEGDHAYVLQQPDKRIIFVIPFEDNFTLIGTTEENFSDNPRAAVLSEAEQEYLCAAFNGGFKKQITPDDIVWDYSGVRALFDDGESEARAVTRDYVLYKHEEYEAPMLSVFGGKLTTYRSLACKALDKLAEMGGHEISPAGSTDFLPGGDIGDVKAFSLKMAEHYPFLPVELRARYIHSYGTRMENFLKGKAALDDMGQHFGNHIYEAELEYLVQSEWARTSDDVLWRRSKLGLHIGPETFRRVEEYMKGLAKTEKEEE